VTADLYITSRDQTVSGALALMMHLLFFALLVFGVTWQKREPAPVVAELWSNLPAPKAAPAPPPPKAEPEPPKPPPKAEAKPVPKVEPKPVPKVEPKPAPKPDIALREKKEKALKAKERELAEKKKREEQARLEALKQQQAKEAEAQRLAREQDEALKKLAQNQAAAQAKLVDEYKRRIAERIKRFIIEPPGMQGNPEVEFDVIVLPGGEVLDVKTRKASGQALWDTAVERAIRRAQPLPLPPDPALMREFRELNLRFRPKE
jgi:colicin import membrane protein